MTCMNFVKTYFRALSLIALVPSLKRKLKTILFPMEMVRYSESFELAQALDRVSHEGEILDV